MNNLYEIHCGDARQILKDYPDSFFDLIITSPPYADARKKHYKGITPDKYPDYFCSFHDEFWRVLKEDGSFILNIKDKVVNGERNRFVWKTILKLSDNGWICIDDYIWHKTNAMPGYWKYRLRDEWEYCFHLTKSKSFKIYQEAIRKPIGDWAEVRLRNLNGKSLQRHNSENESGFGRDLRAWQDKKYVLPGNVLDIPLVGKNMGHPAVFPLLLPEFFIKLFTKEKDIIIDPFAGSGTTGVAAFRLNRKVVLIELEEKYISIMKDRLFNENPPLENLIINY